MIKLYKFLLFVFLLMVSLQFVTAGEDVFPDNVIENILQERVDKHKQAIGLVVGIVNENFISISILEGKSKAGKSGRKSEKSERESGQAAI